MFHKPHISLEDILPMIEFALDRSAPELHLDCDLYVEAGMDSLGAVALVVEIQRSFGVRIADHCVSKLTTPRHWIEAVAQHARSGVEQPGDDS